jgi:Fe-S cluster assembly protein SufD
MTSLARALIEDDDTLLPSRRDEDWRWTDLRGALRVLPKPAAATVSEKHEAGRLERTFKFVQARGYHGAFALEVPAGEHLVLIDRVLGAEAAYAADLSLSFRLGEGASLERIAIHRDCAEAVSVTTAEVTLAPGARFSQTVLAAGAKRQRIETRVSHPGGGAAVRLDGAYVLTAARHSDQTTEVRHQGRDGECRELVKGVVADQARGVFQGRIVVAHGADGTDAKLGHHALVLSDKAEVDSKPELEIYADDVACAHGNTVGALDEEALFYARARGIAPLEAKRLLTEAFLAEVVERIEDAAARELATTWLADRLKEAAHD